MEIFLRLAEQKFVKSGLVKTYAEAAKGTLDYLRPVFSTADSHVWRKTVLWQEGNDLALKRQVKVLQRLYDRFSGA